MDQNFQPDFSSAEPREPGSSTQPLRAIPPAEPLPLPEIVDPGFNEELPKKSNTGLILLIILLVVLCCCCILVAAVIYTLLYGAYWLGDSILNLLNQVIPGVFTY